MDVGWYGLPYHIDVYHMLPGWGGTVYIYMYIYICVYIYNYIYIIYLTLSNHRLVTPGCRATVCLPSAPDLLLQLFDALTKIIFNCLPDHVAEHINLPALKILKFQNRFHDVSRKWC